MHDDNVSGLHARKYCSVSVLQREKYLFKISGPDWGVCECHLFSQKNLWVSPQGPVFCCASTPTCQNLRNVFSLLFLFHKHKILLEANDFWGRVNSSPKNLPQTFVASISFSTPDTFPSPLFFVQIKQHFNFPTIPSQYICSFPIVT